MTPAQLNKWKRLNYLRQRWWTNESKLNASNIPASQNDTYIIYYGSADERWLRLNSLRQPAWNRNGFWFNSIVDPSYTLQLFPIRTCLFVPSVLEYNQHNTVCRWHASVGARRTRPPWLLGTRHVLTQTSNGITERPLKTTERTTPSKNILN